MHVQVRNDNYYMNFSRQTFILMNMIETLSKCFMRMELGLYVVAEVCFLFTVFTDFC